MNFEHISSKKSNFAAKQVGEDLVLVPIKDNVAEMNEMFTLNEVGTFIWENLTEDATMEALSKSMVDEFDIDQETATADLEEFLAQIEKMMNA